MTNEIDPRTGAGENDLPDNVLPFRRRDGGANYTNEPPLSLLEESAFSQKID